MSNANLDTIAALATPPGRGGIAIIRIAGSQVKKITAALLQTDLPPRIAKHLPFYDEKNQVLDIGVAIFFASPHSFTGEDILELHSHGSPIVVDLLLERILQLGARLAKPGEFSERAFLNDKLDLVKAEAIADLIDASSKEAARLALRSLQGEFSKIIHALNDKIIYLRMYIEAAIDFSDEEIEFWRDEKIAQQLAVILNELTRIQDNAKQGSFLREGIHAVIMGEPNVGKSSLLNQLSGKDIAIVTAIPGTTRDVLREYILIDDIPMYIIDTAGLRDSADVIEQEGIKRAYQELEKADLILYLLDAEKIIDINFKDLSPQIFSRPVIFVRNKIDLTRENPQLKMLENSAVISLSVKENRGLDLLKDQIKQTVGFKKTTEGLYLARRRHLDALSRTTTHVNAALVQIKNSQSGELAAEDLRLAQQSLSEITGEFTADDLLGKIFANFCIGK